MRILMRIGFPVETANAAMKAGTMPQTIKAILDEQKPESAYFYDEGGRRAGVVVVNISDASQIPAIAEPWFLAFNASIHMHAAMVPADLMKASPAIEAAVKKYG
jgi:hypothetical protein